jgi:hypothetical protein
MRLIAATIGCLMALSSALAQSVAPQPPGVLPPVPAPGPSGPVQVAPSGPITPPKLDTFGDRVNRALQSYPLDAGVGNNPTDRDSYVRQRGNE